ncbi:MAG: hypothetical protein ACK4MX_04220 [Thermaurantiacus sp.]
MRATARFGAAAIAVAISAAVQAQGAPRMIPPPSIADMRKVLTSLGYTVQNDAAAGEKEPLLVEIGGQPTNVTVAGCNDRGAQCRYAMLLTTFTDVRNPPGAWLGQANYRWDFTQVSLDREGHVLIALAIPFGTEGLPLTSLRWMLEMWPANVGGIAQLARDGGVVGK